MSINGKPFKPDPTSYSETGIPCGNPLRYKSRAVIRTTFQPSIPFENQQIGIPGKGTITEAEKYLKILLEKQLKTNINGNVQNKNFISPKDIQTFGNLKCGLQTLEEFQKQESLKRIKELREYSKLTEEEIKIKLEEEGFKDKIEKQLKKRKLANPEHTKKEIEFFKKKIELENQLKKENENDPILLKELGLSRHMQEIERSLLIGKEHIPLAHLFLTDKKNNHTNQDYDNNDILENVKNEENKSNINDKCNLITSSSIPSISEIEIQKNKITLEEIKKLDPKYHPGEISKILYLKNLHKKVTEIDLLSLFIRFQKENQPKIIFKLIKKRGRAFITFPDSNIATEAMNLINGYILNGKPIIIEFGKKGINNTA